MALVDRVRNICLTPNTEWPVIAAEPASTGALMTGYVVPLAAIGAIAGFIGGSLVGRTLPYIGSYRVPLMSGLVFAVFTICMAVVGVFILSFVINALAPTFGAEQNSTQALKVAVYSYTPAWVAGVLQIVPLLGIFAIFAAFYGIYLLYLGLPALMKCPPDKAIGYTAVVVICAIVLTMVLGAISAMFAGAGMLGAHALGAGALGGAPPASSDVQFDKNSPMGKLQTLSNKIDESTKKMEAAQKSGDQKAQAAAAFEGLGALLGGGNRVDPISIDQLKTFVPPNFAGLAKTTSNVEKTGMAGIMVSKAEATYADGAGKRVNLEISDTGGVSGLVAFATWTGVEGEREDDRGSEKTVKVDGRLVHERISKNGGSNEFGIVVGDRFVINASGSGVSVDDLKSAVSSLDLSKLESMKDVGVKK
jgi:hypothetical protein